MSVRLKITVALLTCALLGLLSIQFYWIDKAIELRKEEFDQKVVLAMQQVVHRLEKQELAQFIAGHRLGRQLAGHNAGRRIRPSGSNPNSHGNGTQNYMRIEHYGRDGSITITEHGEVDSSTRTITRERQANGNSSLQIEMVQHDLPFTPVDGKRGMDSSVIKERLKYRSAFIDDIIFEIMGNEMSLGIEDRIDLNLIDSLLTTSLDEMKINTDIQFGVTDFFGHLLAYAPENSQVSQVMNSPFRVRLFPNDIFGDAFYLNLYFPHQRTFLLSTMWITLSASAVFLILIAGAFAYTISIIRREKKLSIIKNDFISNMTHELKTPISTISLACEALADSDISTDSEKKGKFLLMIGQENKRLSTLVDNVLRASIWDKSGFKLKSEETDMHEIVAEVAATTGMIAEKSNGLVHLQLEADQYHVMGDKVHLTNIISNLAENALKYSDHDLDITFKSRSEHGKLVIEVADRGRGIPREHLVNIFEKFYRVPTGNIHNTKGFGLGLSYVRSIVEGHGGDITVSSNPGKGTTFRVTLPLMKKKMADV